MHTHTGNGVGPSAPRAGTSFPPRPLRPSLIRLYESMVALQPRDFYDRAKYAWESEN
jgi:hypothetical protein